ncbi:MAG: TonB-dependent receptor [Planctomycetes bacterium]|nr:TonB-dependent receptor [Planctomycetota bacterium]
MISTVLIPMLAPVLQAPLPGETIVTAPRMSANESRSAATVTILTGEDIARTGERSLPRAIAKAAGIGIWMQETNLGGGAPILRGLVGEKILIVIDGVRINDATTRLGPNQSLNTIDPAIIERVEIVRGPSAVQYGSDAMGGTILLYTRQRAPGSVNLRGVEDAPQVGLDGTYSSSSNGSRGSLSIADSARRDGWILIGSLENWNELRSGDGTIDNTGYGGNAVFGSWIHALDDERSLRLTGRIHRDFDVPRTDRLNVGFGQTQPSSAEFLFTLQDSTAATLTYDDRHANVIADRMQARFFLREYTEERRQRNSGSTQRRFEVDDTRGYGFGIDLQKLLGESHLLTYGIDLEVDEVQSSRTNVNITTGIATPGQPGFAPNSHYESIGLFAQDEILAFEPFDVTLGARYSRFDFRFNEFTSGPAGGPKQTGDFDAVTAAIQVARPLSDHLRASGTVSQGFRAPHLDDLARNSTAFGGTELANPDIDPETSVTAELALDYDNGVWSGAVAAYYTKIDDLIGRRLVDEGVPGTLGDETYLRENTGELDLYGIELAVTRKLGGADADFAARIGIATQQGRQSDDTVNPLTGSATYDDVPARRIPPLNGFAALLYSPADSSWFVHWAELRLTVADGQRRLNPDDVSDPRIGAAGTPGWATLSADFGGPLGGKDSISSWSVGVHNILDRDYRVHGSGFDAPGIGVVVGLSWNF